MQIEVPMVDIVNPTNDPVSYEAYVAVDARSGYNCRFAFGPGEKGQVPEQHTVARQDHTGKLVRPSLISQLAPQLCAPGKEKETLAKLKARDDRTKREYANAERKAAGG